VQVEIPLTPVMFLPLTADRVFFFHNSQKKAFLPTNCTHAPLHRKYGAVHVVIHFYLLIIQCKHMLVSEER
jgi:hypothetical protein